MNDGCGENGKEIEHAFRKRKSSGNDGFAQAVAMVSVAQLCESVGFHGFHQSALDSLSDVTVRYIKNMGKSASTYANLAGRIESNVFDIIQALEDLGSLKGFSGASDVRHCLVGSGVVRELSRYVEEAEEIPIAYAIPSFPVFSEQESARSFEQVGQLPSEEHIPSWLPTFPAPETYVPLPSGNEREVEIQADKNDNLNEHADMKSSLLNFKQLLPGNGPEATIVVDPGEAAKAKQAADSNPFLAAPLQSRQKEVSSLVPPAKLSDGAVAGQYWAQAVNHASVMDTFTPATEAFKGRLSDSEEGRENVILNKGTDVQLKFRISKKFPNTALRKRSVGIGKSASWFGNDDEKDDRKRRADQILKESMETPHELAQL